MLFENFLLKKFVTLFLRGSGYWTADSGNICTFVSINTYNANDIELIIWKHAFLSPCRLEVGLLKLIRKKSDFKIKI